MEKTQKDALLEQMMCDYGDELVRLAYAYVKDVGMAQDLVQNAFIKSYKHLDSFRQDANVKTWLYRITINECKDYLKSWHYRMVRVKEVVQEATKVMLPSTEKVMLDQLERQHVQELVFTLPKLYREVVYLYYYESLTTEEIAQVLDVSVHTVKTRLRRARQKLQPIVKEAKLNGR